MRVSVTLIEKYYLLNQQNQSSFNWKFLHIFKIVLRHKLTFYEPKYFVKGFLKTQRVSVTWPKYQCLSDKEKEGGSLTTMFFPHCGIYDLCFSFQF